MWTSATAKFKSNYSLIATSLPLINAWIHEFHKRITVAQTTSDHDWFLYQPFQVMKVRWILHIFFWHRSPQVYLKKGFQKGILIRSDRMLRVMYMTFQIWCIFNFFICVIDAYSIAEGPIKSNLLKIAKPYPLICAHNRIRFSLFVGYDSIPSGFILLIGTSGSLLILVTMLAARPNCCKKEIMLAVFFKIL